MEISPFFFYFFAGLAIVCALMVVLKKNPVASAFSLVLVFFAFAGVYAVLDAHLIAALQVLVYAGAIMVLFVFVIMLLNADAPTFDFTRTRLGYRIAASFSGLLLLGAFIWVFKHTTSFGPAGPYTAEAIVATGGNTQVVSELMFSEYILPFEMTSVLLLGAIVGAIAIAKRKST